MMVGEHTGERGGAVPHSLCAILYAIEDVGVASTVLTHVRDPRDPA